ncbi:MAG: signal peptidase I [Bacilli bacterium]|nr:signal peptidase I [Bacilli bacterium]
MEKEKEEEKTGFQKFLKEYVPYIVFLIAIILFKTFCYAPVYVSGDSMLTTLKDGDIMILDIIGSHKDYKRFDIVVVNNGKELIIKRVIGLPGETIEYKSNQLYVNGKKVKDPYGSTKTDDFSTKVPQGKYYVLGDNRQNSMDSRFYGAFSKKQLRGKTKFVIFPFNRFGSK